MLYPGSFRKFDIINRDIELSDDHLNADKASLLTNCVALILILSRMEGFIVFDYEKEYPHALRELAQWLAEGKIKRKETIVKGGLQNAERALRDLYEGRNTGKYEYLPMLID